MKNTIRFKFAMGGLWWFSPERQWVRITSDHMKEFLTMLGNVTKGYNL
jgi:hypothetical protein